MFKIKPSHVVRNSSVLFFCLIVAGSSTITGCSSDSDKQEESLPYADTVENRKKANKIYEQLDDLKRAGKFDQTEKVIDEIAKYYPGEKYRLRAEIDYSQGKYEEADKKMDEALKVEPDNQAYWEYAATCAYKAGNDEKALERATTCLEKKGASGPPSNANLVRGMVYRKQGKYEKAIEELNTCLKTDTSNVEAFYFKGVCFDAQGKPQEALAAFNEALRWYPTLQSAIKRRLAIYMRLKDRAAAKRELERSAQQAKVKVMTSKIDWIPIDLSTAQVQAIEKNPKAE